MGLGESKKFIYIVNDLQREETTFFFMFSGIYLKNKSGSINSTSKIS